MHSRRDGVSKHHATQKEREEEGGDGWYCTHEAGIVVQEACLRGCGCTCALATCLVPVPTSYERLRGTSCEEVQMQRILQETRFMRLQCLYLWASAPALHGLLHDREAYTQ